MLVMRTNRLTGFFKYLEFPEGSEELELPYTAFTAIAQEISGSAKSVGLSFKNNFSDTWFQLKEILIEGKPHGILIPDIKDYEVPVNSFEDVKEMSFCFSKTNPKNFFDYIKDNIETHTGIKVEVLEESKEKICKLVSKTGPTTGKVFLLTNVYFGVYSVSDLFIETKLGVRFICRQEKMLEDYFNAPQESKLVNIDTLNFIDMKLGRLRISY